MLMCILTVVTHAQSTRRKGVRPIKEMPVAAHDAAPMTDSIITQSEISSLIKLSGFKKAVASRVETVMITNLSDTDTIKSVRVDIDYRTPEGAQLNRREVIFDVTVPPGETRAASVTSWDRQQLFYHIDTPPSRITQRMTAFTVTFSPLAVIITRGAYPQDR